MNKRGVGMRILANTGNEANVMVQDCKLLVGVTEGIYM